MNARKANNEDEEISVPLWLWAGTVGSYLKRPVTGVNARASALLLGMITVPKGPYGVLHTNGWYDVDEVVDKHLGKSITSGHIKKRIDVNQAPLRHPHQGRR